MAVNNCRRFVCRLLKRWDSLINEGGIPLLMMEETDTGECHGNAVLVAGGNDMVVAHTSAGLRHKLHTAFMGTLDVVAEGEERIGT